MKYDLSFCCKIFLYTCMIEVRNCNMVYMPHAHYTCMFHVFYCHKHAYLIHVSEIFVHKYIDVCKWALKVSLFIMRNKKQEN